MPGGECVNYHNYQDRTDVNGDIVSSWAENVFPGHFRCRICNSSVLTFSKGMVSFNQHAAGKGHKENIQKMDGIVKMEDGCYPKPELETQNQRRSGGDCKNYFKYKDRTDVNGDVVSSWAENIFPGHFRCRICNSSVLTFSRGMVSFNQHAEGKVHRTNIQNMDGNVKIEEACDLKPELEFRPEWSEISISEKPHTDTDLSNSVTETTPRKFGLAGFVAQYLQDLVPDLEDDMNFKLIKQKILHLTFLVNLVCKFEDFDAVYEEYKSVQEDLKSGTISWDDEQYFREWEEAILRRENDNNQENDEDGEESVMKSELHFAENFEEDSISKSDSSNPITDNDNGICINISRPKKKRKRTGGNKKSEKQTEKEKKKFKLMKVKPGKKRMICYDCCFQTASNKNYMKHMFEKHEQNLCTECGLSFDRFDIFYLHQETHLNEYVCDICSVGFRNNRILVAHQKNDHNIQIEEKLEVCPHCGIFVKHVKDHIKRKHERVLQCTECDYATDNKRNLENHFKARHTNETVTSCPYCNKIVKTLANHLDRMKCHLSEEEKQRLAIEVKCEICQKSFPSHLKLRRHVIRMHTDAQFQCEICNFQTKHVQNLKQHVRTVHEKKPVKESCPYCNKTCTSLEWHINTFHNSASADF